LTGSKKHSDGQEISFEWNDRFIRMKWFFLPNVFEN